MTLTLLLDLDDTLLGNDMGTFVPAYLRALAGHLAPYADGNRMVPTLLSSTQAMTVNDNPARTLKETFDEQFYPKLGWDRDAMQAPIVEFYRQEFPKLKSVTQYRPEAVHLVEDALARGYRITIATNPLFPGLAIHERLRWAGLPPEQYVFDLVTTYESFHFAKPHPAYYAEILGQLGWPEDPVVMVGDNPQNDVGAARRVGIPTFQVNGKPSAGTSGELPPFGGGGLPELLPWVDTFSSEELLPRLDQPDAIRAILKSTPAALDTLTRSLSSVDCAHLPLAGEWSLTEVLCHLRDAETAVNFPRLQRILENEKPLIQGVDTNNWAEERDYRSQDGPQALVDFTAARAKTVALLSGLSTDDWQRPARHTIFGPTTLQELANFSARHDRLHLNQIKRLLSKQDTVTR